MKIRNSNFHIYSFGFVIFTYLKISYQHINDKIDIVKFEETQWDTLNTTKN